MIDKQAIRGFLAERAGKNVNFGDGDSLLEAQIIDSLAMAELIVFLESTFKVSFEPEELTPENLGSVNAIVGFLERKCEGVAGDAP